MDGMIDGWMDGCRKTGRFFFFLSFFLSTVMDMHMHSEGVLL